MRLTHQQHIEIFKRHKAGETMTSLAEEFGVSRQAVSLLVMRRENWDKDGFKPAKRGRPQQEGLNSEHRKFLQDTVMQRTPAEVGLEKYEGWTASAAMELLKRQFNFNPSRAQVYDTLKGWGMLHLPRPKLEDYDFDPEFYEYLKSPAAAELRRREQEWMQREQERRAAEGPPKRRLGRPPKNPPAETDSDLTDSDLWSGGILTAEDIQKRLDAFPDQRLVREMTNRHLAGRPGLRVGKHGKNRGERHHRKKRR